MDAGQRRSRWRMLAAPSRRPSRWTKRFRPPSRTAPPCRPRPAAWIPRRPCCGRRSPITIPSIGLSANYGITDNPPQAFMMTLNQRTLNMQDPAFDPNNPDDTDNLRGSIAAQWRIFDRQRDAGKHMARFGAEASAEAFAAARNQLVHEVTRGFYGVLQAQAFADVQAAVGRQHRGKPPHRPGTLRCGRRGQNRRPESRNPTRPGQRRPHQGPQRRATGRGRAQRRHRLGSGHRRQH